MSAQVQQHTKDSTGPGSNLLLILIVRHTAAGKERRGEKRKGKKMWMLACHLRLFAIWILQVRIEHPLNLLRSMVKALAISDVIRLFIGCNTVSGDMQKFLEYRGNKRKFVNKRNERERAEKLERSERSTMTSKTITTVLRLPCLHNHHLLYRVVPIPIPAQDPMQSNMMEMVSASTWVHAPILYYVTS